VIPAGVGEPALGVPQVFVREGASAEEWPAAMTGRGAEQASVAATPAAAVAAAPPRVTAPVQAPPVAPVQQSTTLARPAMVTPAPAPAPPHVAAVAPKGPSEPWMKEEGEDRFGRFGSFEVRGVVHRMRWIPPGMFVMGSPQSEAGRFNDEGPQHQLTLTRGYWLGETPCTQALWRAVMGTNPSRFQSPDRPVEQVSWGDCQAFLEKLGGLAAGLPPRLPAEAEWEYACRAGTTHATWAGGLDIQGQRNAPALDAIAWYGGNSGVGFELHNGAASSDWPEKQYPHMKVGTRSVGKKAANPFGLYDMLGNVWEWCEDGQRAYTAASVTDPRGPTDAGSGRVIRGGSWRDYARDVRAASRRADRPGGRSDDLGFRLCR